MKKMKKIITLALVLVMVLGLATTAMAANVTKAAGVTGDASITVNLPAVPQGSVVSNTYKIYQVFTAIPGANNTITYGLVGGKTTVPACFTVDDDGYVNYNGTGTDGALTAADISAIAAYVANDTPVATVTTTQDDTSFTVEGLPYGYYYINTTTGTVVTVNTARSSATVNDKNTVPTVDKKITGATGSIDAAGKNAIAQVGTDVTYTATVTVGKGAENYIYHDTMSNGLSFNSDSVVVTGATAGTDYEVKAGTNGEDFVIEFKNSYISTLAEGAKIVISYTAKITNGALTVDPENNTAYVSYGHTPGQNKTPNSETKVYSAKITVKKYNNENKALEGAGFVLKNSENKYYKLADGVVSWVDAIADATEYKSDANGEVQSFTGLPSGAYTLIENTVPSGYTKAADKSFAVEEGTYTAANLEQSADVINNPGSQLPSTGGMGTTLFYVFGAVMVMGAAVLLVTKKRMAR